MAELFVERCGCGIERRPVDNWCRRCLRQLAPPALPVGMVSWRPPQLERSGPRPVPTSFRRSIRIVLTVLLGLLLVRAWWGVAMHWGSARLLLDVLWVPALSGTAGLWLTDVWDGSSAEG